MNSKTRLSLLERIRDAADASAWEDFWRHYGAVIFQFAKRRGCSDITAQDVVQDVMLEVFQDRDVFHYDPAKGRFHDWLGGVVRNVVCRRRRSPAERTRAVGGSSDRGLDDHPDLGAAMDDEWQELFDDGILAALLDIVRGEVSPATYQAFELTAIQEMPGTQVARLTGLSRNAVYQARKRVLERLRELGASYREHGQLVDRVKHALVSRVPADVERTMASTMEETIQRRRKDGERWASAHRYTTE